jgi:membrane-associated phospholipid phosphatase
VLAAEGSLSYTPALPRLPIRDISTEEVIISGVASAAVLGAALAPWPNAQTGWRGGILFDDAARDAMMLRDPGARHVASLVSDGLVLGLTALPVLVDSAIIAWAVRGDPELAARMMLIDLQAHAIAQGVTAIAKHVAGRERPLARGCRVDPERAANDAACQGSNARGRGDKSFFSGHTSLAFTSAALICLHHTELGLLGPGGDAAMCATGLTLASAVGALRIMSDKHYASDVLIGAGVGLLSGWLVPWLLNYDIADRATNGAVHAQIAPMADNTTAGIQIFGTF